MKPLIFALEPGLPLFEPLLTQLDGEAGALSQRQFPDGESYLRIDCEVRGRACVVLADFCQPNAKFLPLAFLTSTLRELGAQTVGVVAPYLSYMRQDCRFQEGEAVTSKVYAELLSRQLDWLVTVDPHLHRYRSLNEIYTIPTTVVQGAPLLGKWLAEQAEPLLLVGPDIESQQWVAAMAEQIAQPYIVGTKVRRGDRDVQVSLPDTRPHLGATAVIVDDVIASGQTILETVKALVTAGFCRIDCAAVHGIFANGADAELLAHGVGRLITTNSIPHPSNVVDLSPLLAPAICQHITAATSRARKGEF